MGEESSVTELIRRAERGDVEAADRLFAATYAELRRLARARLRAGGRNTLLDTSSLVHESYLRFARAGQLELRDRIHFMRWADRLSPAWNGCSTPVHPDVALNSRFVPPAMSGSAAALRSSN